MKEIKAKENIFLEDFDVYVNQYLTYAQIQQIVNAVIKFDTWSERYQNIDMLILYHATDINKEELEKYDVDILKQSGLIDAVKNNIINLNELNEAIEYTTSIQRALSQILKQMPQINKALNKGDRKNGNKK